MQLIPRALVIGGFAPPAPLGEQQVTADRLNRIWSEVAPAYGFTQLQMRPDHAGGQFIGRTNDDGVLIQPPLIQVRSTITATASVAAENAQAIVSVILRHLGVGQIFNLGIKHIYNAPLPDNDARTFVLHRLLSRSEDDLAPLTDGSMAPWGGVKYVIPLPDRHYTVAIEPLQQDQMRSLFIDLDAQFPGPIDPGSIINRAQEADGFVTGPVNRYLDQLADLH